MDINDKIRLKREESGISKRKLAKKASLSEGCIRHIENKTVQSSRISTLRKIADALEINFEDLVKE